MRDGRTRKYKSTDPGRYTIWTTTVIHLYTDVSSLTSYFIPSFLSPSSLSPYSIFEIPICITLFPSLLVVILSISSHLPTETGEREWWVPPLFHKQAKCENKDDFKVTSCKYVRFTI